MRARLLHFVTTLDRGGAENALLDLLPRLDPDRFEMRVAWLKGAGELAPEFEERGVATVGLGMRSAFDVGVLLRAARLARQWRPHLVHTHLFKADVAGAHAADSARARLVSTKHNEDPQLRWPGVRTLARRVARQADAVVAISEAVRRHVTGNLDLAENDVKLIRYGIDLAEMDARPDAPDLRSEIGAPPGTPLLVFAGRLVPQKALEVLISSMVRIRQQVPAVRLAIVGRGPQETEMRERVRALDLEPHVRFLGFRPDAPSLMRQADLLVLPSRWEGLGLVLLEAMAARCPVVASRIGAIPEVVDDGRTGRLVPPEDPDTLADTVLGLLADPARRESMAAAGRERLRERFSLGTQIAATEALYEGLLDRPKVRARPRRKTRVMLVSRPGTGGAGRHIQLLAETLDLDKFELHAAVSSLEEASFPETLRRAGARVELLDLDRPVRPRADLRALLKLIGIVRRVRPDVLHAHASKAGVLARLAGGLLGVPTAYVPHGYAFGYTGDGLSGGIHYRLIERACRAFTDALLCVSPAECQTAWRHRLASRDRTHLVPNAVDPAEYRRLPDRALVRERLGLPPDARVALMVARLAEPKDPLTFVRAGAFLPLGPPAPRMLLVGDGPLLEPCLELALESGLGDTLVCPGPIHDMPALLSAADVLVLSTNYEGLPYVLLEGLAAGLPVVASDVPGCRPLLAGGRGHLVPTGDAPAMGRAIEEAFTEPRGPSRLPPGYDLESWIEQIESIYENLRG